MTSQPIDSQLLEILRCPVTHSNLSLASTAVIDDLNRKIATKELVNRVGQTVAEPIDGGLLNESGDLLLPIRGGISILVADQAIEMDK